MAIKKKKQVALEDIFEAPSETLEDKLYNVRKDILALQALSKKYAAQLLEDMKTNGLRRGERFKISLRQSLKVTEADTAFKWAAERNCIDINTSKAMRLIRREFEVPEGFEVQSTEYLSMTGTKDETNDDNAEADS